MEEIRKDCRNRQAGACRWARAGNSGEVSWQNSRIGVPAEANSDNPMNILDIRLDAERIKNRREMLAQLGLS